MTEANHGGTLFGILNVDDEEVQGVLIASWRTNMLENPTPIHIIIAGVTFACTVESFQAEDEAIGFSITPLP